MPKLGVIFWSVVLWYTLRCVTPFKGHLRALQNIFKLVDVIRIISGTLTLFLTYLYMFLNNIK